MEHPKYHLQKKESCWLPKIHMRYTFPVTITKTSHWKDIAVSDDKEILTEYMEYLKTENPKAEYRIEVFKG